MLKWLRLTLLRLGITLLVGLIVLIAGLWLPARYDRKIIPQQLAYFNNSSAKIGHTQQIIKSLPNLANIQVQQLGAINDYSHNFATSAHDCLKDKLPRQPAATSFPGLHLSKDDELIKAVQSNIAKAKGLNVGQAANDQLKACRSIAYQAQITKDLTNILEYNPQIDSQNFDLKSADTQKRLNLAKQGLNNTLQKLQKDQDINDQSLASVTSAVQSLQPALQQLTSSGDPNQWINQVNKNQLIIIGNRALFWQASAKKVLTALQADANNLSSAQKAWQQTAVQYSTN